MRGSVAEQVAGITQAVERSDSHVDAVGDQAETGEELEQVEQAGTERPRDGQERQWEQ